MNDMIRVMLNRMASNQRQCTCSLSVAFVIHILIETKQNRKKNRNSNTHTVTSRRYIAKDGVRQREGAKKNKNEQRIRIFMSECVSHFPTNWIELYIL